VVQPAHLRHLAGRFFGSLRPGGPSPADEAWVWSLLLPGERALWGRMSGADRRHAVGVARRVPAELAVPALLHDVGKVESGLGTFRRVAATVVGPRTARFRQYREHPSIGARLLREAGSADLTVRWAEEHHLPRARWTVPQGVGDILKAADDD
jgi:hypothetical protein